MYLPAVGNNIYSQECCSNFKEVVWFIRKLVDFQARRTLILG